MSIIGLDDVLPGKRRGVGYTRAKFNRYKARLKTKAARQANKLRRYVARA